MSAIKKKKTVYEIMVVEDSATQALLVQSLLEENGYRAIVARDGRDAISLLKERIPDLLISDIMMPEMDGYTLCREIKSCEQWRHIPVILLTQLSEAEDIVKGLESGADNFVTKPFNPELLISQVEYLLVNTLMRKGSRAEIGINVFFAGKRHNITSGRKQILDLLFSTYENSLAQKRELEKKNRELKEALETVKTLQGIIPICANCKKIRDDKGAWSQMESYISKHSEAQFSHGICPECAKKLYPGLVLSDKV